MEIEETTTIGGLSQDEVMALLEVHAQRIETGSWPKRVHVERGQPNRIRVIQELIEDGILDEDQHYETLQITPQGREKLYAVCEVLMNFI